MRTRSIAQVHSSSLKKHRMAGYRPAYADSYQQSMHSQHDVDQGLGRNDWQPAAYQVDSWRSYRDDTTNLQQIASHMNPYDCNYGAPIQQQHPQVYQHVFNPYANPFQPVYPGSVLNLANSQFTPYQPLRISNGQQERNAVHQARLSSSTANNRHGRQYALRSHGTINSSMAADVDAIHDLPLPSIEKPEWNASSVPTKIRPWRKSEFNTSSASQRQSPTATPPPAPSPTAEYLAQANLSPTQSATPQKLLVVVDLNGTLLKRTQQRSNNFVLRPGVANFMDYLFTNHIVMVYTSARPENAHEMVQKLLPPKQRGQLAAIWARDKLDLNRSQYFSKVQVYKKLEKIWADELIQQRAGKECKWDQSNTVLLDDSHLKALAQPYNLLRVEEFTNNRPTHGKVTGAEELHAYNVWVTVQLTIVQNLQAKLEELRYTQDVSQLIRQWQATVAERTEHPSSQNFELEARQILTPNSSEPRISEDDEGDDGVDSRQNSFDRAAYTSGQHVTTHHSGDDNGHVSDASVSSIDEAVWKEILGDGDKTRDEPPTPKSVGR